MSRYTTELRYVCEYYAGLEESVGYDQIKSVIEKSKPYIFDFDYPIFDENYRPYFESMFLKHYYFREIGFDTPARFKLELDDTLNTIMPYYNKLFEALQENIKPFLNVNYNKIGKHNTKDTETINRELEQEDSFTGNMRATQNSNDTRDRSNNSNSNEKRRHSDTPMSQITNLENGSYLSDADITDNTQNEAIHENTENKLTGNTDTNNQSSTNSNENTDRDYSSAKDYIETITGYSGTNAGKLLLDYRNGLININREIWKELDCLFMGLTY